MFVTQALIDRVVDMEIDNIIARVSHYRDRPGNPSGVAIERFGRATAFAATNIPVRLFNSVLGGSDELAGQLDDIEAFYRAHNGEGAIELIPGRTTEVAGRALASRGYQIVEFHAGMARALTEEDRELAIGEPEVVEIDGRNEAELDRFLDVYLAGWKRQPNEQSKANPRCWRHNERWRFYIARVDGVAAGAAILDVLGDTAMFASGATVPAFRGRGVQASLIAARIRDAARAGCDLMVGGAIFGSSSMRNQMRAGMALVFARTIVSRD